MGAKSKRFNLTSSHEADIKYLCGNFSYKLLKIFSENPEVILVTPAHRRQVWYSVLSAPNFFENPQINVDSLQYAKSQNLIASAYGTSPSFMFTMLKRIGVKPQSPDWYQDLHRILDKKPDIGHHLINARNLVSTVEVLGKFPSEFQNVNFAGKFSRSERAEDFFAKFKVLSDFAKIEDADSYLHSKILAGCDPNSILQSIYEMITFQPPVLKQEEGLTYLSSVKALKDASREFNNCLMTRVDEAFCDAHQHYTLTFGEDQIVFSIQKMSNNTWQLYEAEDKTNLFVDGSIEEKMKSILQNNNVSLIERLSMLAA